MTLLSLTHGTRQGSALFVVPSLRINVGAWPPDPARPWQPAHPFCTYSAAPSRGGPRPRGSARPVGLIEISHARISPSVGGRPTPYPGDCADAIWHRPTTISGRSLREAIQHAPVARHLPRLHGVVVAADARSLGRVVPVPPDFGSRRLHGAEFIGAARHEHTLGAVPVPVEPEARVRHSIGGRRDLRVVPALAAVGGDVHF